MFKSYRLSGINSVSLGLRYRYLLSREYPPYIVAYWRSALGQSVVLEQGKDHNEFGLVAGVRMWF